MFFPSFLDLCLKIIDVLLTDSSVRNTRQDLDNSDNLHLESHRLSYKKKRKKNVVIYTRDFSLGFAKKKESSRSTVHQLTLSSQRYTIQIVRTMNTDENDENEKYEDFHRALVTKSVRKTACIINDFKYSRHIKLMQCPSIETPQPVFSYVDSRY